MKTTMWTGLLLIVGASACTSILGNIDFEGTGGTSSGRTSSNGGGGSTSSSITGVCATQACTDDTSCSTSANPCVVSKCDQGCCASHFALAGTVATGPTITQKAGDCQVIACDGEGNTETIADDSDLPDDVNECTTDLCNGGVPSHQFLHGKACTRAGGAGFCGATPALEGKCVECEPATQATDCPASGLCSATSGTCIAAGCNDKTKNGDETDVDCGGSCGACAAGRHCTKDGDCAAGFCDPPTKTCVVPSCDDGAQNGSETDLDCGGPACGSTCADGRKCLANTDCISLICGTQGVCSAPSCSDQTKNGSETGVDCGNVTTTGCPTCPAGQGCSVSADCDSGVCGGGLCAAPSCGDHVKNGTETDVDCGGACSGCAVGRGCSKTADCAGGVHGAAACTSQHCTFTCNGGFMDCDGLTGCETDVSTRTHCGGCNTVCVASCASGACNDPIAVGAGGGTSCAILADGSVYCWGVNSSGQIADGTTNNALVPKKIALPKAATAVTAGDFQACAILSDKTLWCWGANTHGQLGQGDLLAHAGPVAVPGLTGVAQVASGSGHVCAVLTTGALHCWGQDGNGQVGNGGSTDVSSPVQVLTSVTKVAAGWLHTCAVKADGKVYCWGLNNYGQLGNGTTTATSSPGVAATGLTGAVEVSAGSGGHVTCARAGAVAYCWGDNRLGQVGVGSAAMSFPTPQALTSLAGVTQVATNGGTSGAITSTGLSMWGYNGFGQVGNGNQSDQPAPVGVSLAGVASLVFGSDHSCALTSDHHVYCWGWNHDGELGTGDTNSRSNPTQVAWP